MLVTIPMGPLGANCYLYGEGREVVAVDPSDAEAVLVRLQTERLTLTHILLTHRHYDHLAGAAELKAAAGCELLIHPLDEEGLFDPNVCHSTQMGGELIPCRATRLVSDGDTFEAAGHTFSVLHTPGHTAGGVCYVCHADRLAFTGDTVFSEGVGRTDLPSGSMRDLMHSLTDKILKLPEEYVLYPGHDEPTTVAHEARYNPMLQYSKNPWFN